MTRLRSDAQGNILDLIFTEDECFVDDIKMSPLGRSDYVCILLKCDTKLYELNCKIEDIFMKKVTMMN